VRAPQLVVLPAQSPALLTLLGAQELRALTAVGLGLTRVLAQRLRTHSEIVREVRDRTTPSNTIRTALDELGGLFLGRAMARDPFCQDGILASRSPWNPGGLTAPTAPIVHTSTAGAGATSR
jgi:hypothetical protein